MENKQSTQEEIDQCRSAVADITSFELEDVLYAHNKDAVIDGNPL